MTLEEINKIAFKYHNEGNNEEAFDYLMVAAKKGYAKSQCNLGVFYKNGYGVSKSYEEAVKWYRLAAEQGDARAQCYLAICYEKGQGVEQSYEEALKWYKLSAAQNYPDAICNIGICYKYGHGVPKSPKEAVKWYKKAADLCDPRGQYNLGVCYYYGNGVEQSYEEAVRLYKLSAEQGYLDAQYNLALCYEKGLGTKQSYEEAIKLYHLASKEEKDALCNIGVCYYYGKGVDISYVEAVKYFELAANKGNALAQTNLGSCYKYGKGVEQSYEKAIEYYEKSLSNGIDKAANSLGYLYFYGEGVTQSFEKAKEYFERAIELGSKSSYALEICKRELGIEDENNYAREFIENLNENNYLQSINDKLAYLFDRLPQTIESKTKTFIKSGLISYYMFYKIQKEEGEELDYTSCIIPMLKGLENEIKKYFIDKYMRYLEKNISVEDFENNYFKIRNKQGDYEYLDVEDRFNKFTLGEFKDLIGLKENISVFAIRDNKTFDENKRTTRVTVIDFTILKFLKNEVFDKEKFTYNIDGEIIDYLVNLNDVITYCTKRLRNPAAHDLVMTREKAETTINYLLFTKKLLVTFYEKMK